MPRALMLTGDAAEELDVMYPLYRVREAGWACDVAALSRRDVQLVIHDFDPNSDAYTEKNGRKLPVDLAFAEVEVEQYHALIIPGGRAPEYIRVDPDVRRITEYFFAKDLPVGTICHGPAGPGRLRPAPGPQDRGVPAAHGRHGERGRHGRRRAGRGRRQHGLLPRLAGHAGVVARVHGRARAHRGPRLTDMPEPAVAPDRFVVDVAGSPVHVHEIGAGPPVLLLHGSGPGTTGWGAWRVVAETLAARHRVIVPDQAGFGGTPFPGGAPDALSSRRAVWVDQARAVMAARGARRYAVVGHSMGGAVALALAATERLRVDARGRRRLDGRLDAAAGGARRAVGGQARGRRRARHALAALPRPRARDRRGRAGARRRDARRRRRLRPALPAAARALGARPRARRRHARRRRRAGAAGARRARPAHAVRVRRAPPARAAAGRAACTRSRAAGTCPRSSTSRSSSVSSPTSWSPMPELAVLRSPAEVLFGSGMAAAAGGVAARHGRRVLVITDPVIAATDGYAGVVALAARGRARRRRVRRRRRRRADGDDRGRRRGRPRGATRTCWWRSAAAARSTWPR